MNKTELKRTKLVGLCPVYSTTFLSALTVESLGPGQLPQSLISVLSAENL